MIFVTLIMKNPSEGASDWVKTHLEMEWRNALSGFGRTMQELSPRNTNTEKWHSETFR